MRERVRPVAPCRNCGATGRVAVWPVLVPVLAPISVAMAVPLVIFAGKAFGLVPQAIGLLVIAVTAAGTALTLLGCGLAWWFGRFDPAEPPADR